jgi:tetratricopeptide (TPR) repeat protein
MPDVPVYEENLALTLTDLGLALHETGLNPKALPGLRESNDMLARLSETYPLIPRYREDLASCQDAIGQVLIHQSEKPSEAVDILAKSVAAYQRLFKESQGRPDYLLRLAIAESHLAKALARDGQSAQAEPFFEESIDYLTQLIEQVGNTPTYANALAHVHKHFGLMCTPQEIIRPRSNLNRREIYGRESVPQVRHSTLTIWPGSCW